MKILFAYLVSKARTIAVFALFAVLFAVSFLLYGLPVGAVLYPAFVCCFVGILYMAADYIRVKRKHDQLQYLIRAAEQLPDASGFAETVTERDLCELALALCRVGSKTRTEQEDRYRDTVDYFTVWAHQIKTPLSSMKLTLDGEDSDTARRLRADLLRTEQYVGMAMAFLRLGSPSTDYVFRDCGLDGLIRSCLRRFSAEFISRRLTLTYEPVEAHFVTDEKWFVFLLEQILSNALKYTRTGGITVYMADERTLCVKDTGIGISPEDLPRIFEKGYTGYNGRIDRSASGLGLYLCKRVADGLGLSLHASSTPGEGTEIRISFPEKTE